MEQTYLTLTLATAVINGLVIFVGAFLLGLVRLDAAAARNPAVTSCVDAAGRPVTAVGWRSGGACEL
jgi:hypothetical protein